MPEQFYQMTWAQYQRYALGYLIRQDREWCRTRSQMWASITPHTTKMVQPSDFYRSLFDSGYEPISELEYETACKAWKLDG